jgi:hypothetical protein
MTMRDVIEKLLPADLSAFAASLSAVSRGTEEADAGSALPPLATDRVEKHFWKAIHTAKTEMPISLHTI